MYYVIKRHDDASVPTFIGFKVPKYISSKKNDTVIFEFIKEDKAIRKWVKKSDIILLTDNQEYFLKIYKELESVQKQQQALVDEARANLDNSLNAFSETMHDEMEKYTQLNDDEDLSSNLF